MKNYFSIINRRTLITLLISIIVPFVCFQNEIVYNVDLTLISIAIIFPLVFTIRGAFRRREKALEHLSRFRTGISIVYYLINDGDKAGKRLKDEGTKLLENISNNFINYLKTPFSKSFGIDKDLKNLYDFVQNNIESFGGGTRQKIFRFMKDIHEGQENLIAIHTHRTPISLKSYCLIFIYIFPFIYTPTLINKIGTGSLQTELITYFVVILSEFILISLYNIQDQMEYPFDADGLDDIKIDYFKMYR